MGPRWRRVAEAGSPVVVVTLDFPTPATVEFCGAIGLPAVAVDLEHAGSAGSLDDLARAAELAGTELIARISADKPMVDRCLDAGIRTLQLTQIESVDDVDRALAWTRYPPGGQRGIGRCRTNRFGHYAGGYPAFVEDQTGSPVTLIVHIETVAAIDHIAAIGDRPEVAAMVVGAQDLSASAGAPGRPGDPNVAALVDRTIEEIAGSPALLGMSASSPGDIDRAICRGARVLLAAQSRLMSWSTAALQRTASTSLTATQKVKVRA